MSAPPPTNESSPAAEQAAVVATVDPRTDPRWEEVARAAGGNLFLSPPWIRAVCDTYEFTPRARVGRDPAGRPGGFAWVEVDDLRGRRTISLPFSDRADPVAGDPALWRALSEGTLGTGGPVPVTLRTLLPSPVADDRRVEQIGEAAWHGTAVGGSTAEMFGRISSHARRNVRVAQRSGVQVSAETGPDAVRAFHALHVRLRREKYRLLAQPLAFFEAIWEQFTREGAVTTLLAHSGGRPIAGALMLRWHDVLYYKFGASDPTQLSVRPNDAVFWAAIELAVEHSVPRIDWGLSELDQPGLVAYKDKWASEQRRIVSASRAGAVERKRGSGYVPTRQRLRRSAS